MEPSTRKTPESGRNRTIGLLLVVLGAAALLLQFVRIDPGSLLWPFAVIVPGLLFFAAVAVWGRPVAGLAIPGSIVTTIGLILLVQNLTGRFETWAYAWGLIPAAVGAGLILQGGITDDPDMGREGRRVAVIGLTLFAAFGLFFELLVFQGYAGTWFGRVLVPLLLIGGGALLLLRPGRGRPRGPSEPRGGSPEAPPEPPIDVPPEPQP